MKQDLCTHEVQSPARAPGETLLITYDLLTSGSLFSLDPCVLNEPEPFRGLADREEIRRMEIRCASCTVEQLEPPLPCDLWSLCMELACSLPYSQNMVDWWLEIACRFEFVCA